MHRHVTHHLGHLVSVKEWSIKFAYCAWSDQASARPWRRTFEIMSHHSARPKLILLDATTETQVLPEAIVHMHCGPLQVL